MSSDLSVASISDIHWGHRNTPTRSILENLDTAFPDNDETGQLDIILMGGDQFDRLLPADDPDLELIKSWWNRFLRMCAKRNICVRVMRGTPSHDWRQNWLLAVEADHARIAVDVAFVDNLCIEYIQSLGIHVLYVPDEWRNNDTDATWKDVQSELTARGLTQVDFSIVHGCFTYQLPDHVTVPRHIPERYMEITRGYVLAAHVHKPSVYGQNLVVNGSFDRISHGEEEDKGHWRIRYNPTTGERSAQFQVNRNARLYVTVQCTGMPLEDALATIRERVATLPHEANVRIRAARTDPIANALELMRKDYPTLKWSSKVDDVAQTQAKMLVDLRHTFHQVAITPDNLVSLITERLRRKGLAPEHIERLQARLSEFV